MTMKVVCCEKEYMLQYFQLQDKFEQKYKSFTNWWTNTDSNCQVITVFMRLQQYITEVKIHSLD